MHRLHKEKTTKGLLEKLNLKDVNIGACTGPVALDISIEELIGRFPEAVGFLSRHAVRCIGCGEPLR